VLKSDASDISQFSEEAIGVDDIRFVQVEAAMPLARLK
jgi:hypothetical protein